MMPKKGRKGFCLIVWIAVLTLMAACPVVSYAAGQTAAASASQKATKKFTGWKKKNGKWYYFEKGALVRKQWRTLKVKLSNGTTVTRKFYFFGNGSACTSVLKYNGKYYTFNARGMLYTSSTNKLFKVGKYYYCPDKTGACQTGWIISNGKLYYANRFGKLVHDITIGGAAGVTFRGIEAVRGSAAVSRLLCMKVIDQVTDSSMTKSQKLYACWRYVVDNCYYVLRYNPELSDPLWMKQKALEMLQSNGGDCISYACAFAGLASTLGYKAKVIHGRVPGTRDGAADGYTTHYWVLINGRQYDPEGESAGWNWNAYATYGYTFDYQVLEVYDYASGRMTGWD